MQIEAQLEIFATAAAEAAGSPLLVRMHPLVRRDLLRRGQFDHMPGWARTARDARWRACIALQTSRRLAD
jgi:hypothetical protein